MKIYILLFLFAFLVINFGCDSTTEPTKEKLLKGIVKDEQGNLLSDVKVFIIYDYGQSLPRTQTHFGIDKPTGISSVELISFLASVLENNVKLSWSTATESENLGFEIQRKINTINDFNTIGFVAGAGTTNEVRNYAYSDTDVNNGLYSYRLKIISVDSTFEYSPIVEVELETPAQTVLSQNFPNPFDISTTIQFQLRKQANVKIDVCRFSDKSVLVNLFDFQKNAGYYSLILQPDSLPGNAFKVLLRIQESDSAYTLEKNILKTFRSYDQSILTVVPNTITKSGAFQIEYDDIPFGQNFYLTGEADPTPLGEFRLRNNLKLVIYKPGYKVVQKDVVIDLNEGQEIQITLEAE